MRSDVELIEAYLLGELSEEDCSAVEERMFPDEEFFDAIKVHEDILIGAYLRGILSASQREHFESHFLTAPRRRERLATARALDAYIAQQVRTDARPSLWERIRSASGAWGMPRLAFAAGALALILTGVGIWVETRQPREVASGPKRAPAGQQQSAGLEQKDNPLHGQTSGKTGDATVHAPAKQLIVPALSLLPGMLRGSDERTLSIGRDADSVRLFLESTYELRAGKYTVAIRNSSDQEVWNKTLNLTHAQKPPIRVDIPAESLAAGSYTLTLARIGADVNEEPPVEYGFSVKHKTP
jgi:anti-sigma factor RsiW